MMKQIILFLLSVLPVALFSQTDMLNEDFEDGIPDGWYVYSANGITWVANDSAGVDEGQGVWARSLDTGEAWIRTPALDLSEPAEYTLEFKVALIGLADEAPDFRLRYRTDEQDPLEHIELTSWGSANTENEIDQTQNLNPQLQEENIEWVTVTYELGAIDGDMTTVRLWFGADHAAPGWALLDAVRVIQTPFPNGIDAIEPESELLVWPNPASSLVHIANADHNIAEITVLNSLGQVVLNRSYEDSYSQSLDLDLSELPADYYVLRVMDETGASSNARLLLRP